MNRWIIAIGVALLGLAGVIAVMPNADALGKIKCAPEVGYAQVDPIVARFVPQSAHLHLFFGNTALLQLPRPEGASYEDLVGQGTNCASPDDTAAYWVPALVYTSGPNAGQPVPVSSFDAYYRSFDHQKHGVAAPFAPDTRLVAGSAMAANPQPLNVVNWTCDQRSSRPGPFHNIVEADCAKATGKVRLTMHVTFPSCWDGQLAPHDVNGNTADNAHFAYFDRKTDTCPAAFPNRMTELRETVWWDYQGDGSDVALVSDLMLADQLGQPVTPGSTGHADFLNAWLETGGRYGGLVGMVHDCIETRTGSAGECG